MQKYRLHKQLYALLLLFLFIASCNGQNQTSLPKDSISELKTMPAEPPKIIKTQGTNQYANVGCGLQDKAGNLWFGTTGEGLYRFDGKSFTNFTVKDGLKNNNVSCILEDKAGNIWVSTNGGVCRYDGKTFTGFSIPDDPKPVMSMLQDKTGNIWFGTHYYGVYRYDGKTFTNFLSDEVVLCMLEDKTGNIWFGSWRGGGAYRYDASRANHPCLKNTCPHDLRIPQDLTDHYQEIDKSFTNFTSAIGDDMISDIKEDKAGNILFCTRDHGVCGYDGQSFTNFSAKKGLNNYNITCTLQDKTGNIWFGTDGRWGSDGNGVYRYDGKSITNFTTKEGLPNNDVFMILEDKTGNIWFGTRDVGLCRYDGTSFTDFSHQVH